MLTTVQKTILNQIKMQFCNEQHVVHLEGPEATGKSTIVQEYRKVVEKYEDWCVYYFEGIKGTSSPFTTIRNSAEIIKNNSKISSVGVTFKIPMTPISLATSFQEQSLIDYKEAMLHAQFSKEKASNIMIIIDSFQYADLNSQQFFIDLRNSIYAHSDNPVSGKKFYMLFVRDQNLSNKNLPKHERKVEDKVIAIEKVRPTDLQEIVKLLSPNSSLDENELQTIYAFSDGDLKYIRMLIEEYNLKKSISPFFKITQLNFAILLEERLERLGDKKEPILKLLSASSIFNDHFKTNSLQNLLGTMEIEPLLAESCKHSFLVESNHFRFLDSSIKDYFYEKIEKTYEIKKFAKNYYEYLKEQEPENYTTRAHYLSLASQKDEHQSEIFGLFCLAYFRSMETPFGQAERAMIEDKINSLDVQKELKIYFENLKSAYSFYRENKYEEAWNELSGFVYCNSLLLRTEIKKWRLIILLMIEDDISRIKISTRELENEIPILQEKKEKEQLFTCKFVLFSTYSNKLDDYDKSLKTAYEIESSLNDIEGKESLEFFQHLFFRKACVYKQAVTSINSTAKSMVYFHEIGDKLQYYLALCNHSANQIILQEYNEALQHIEAGLDLIVQNPNITFPCPNKFKNNQILAEFLKGSTNPILAEDAIQKALEKFGKLFNDKSTEAKKIIAINTINLQIMSKNYETAFTQIAQLEEEVLSNNEHTFYDYYLLNLKLCLTIMKQEWDQAASNVNELCDSFPKYFTSNESLIKGRNRALEKMVRTRIVLEPYDLDQWIYENSGVKNDAGKFYCRLFLFSDLQFTSI